MIILGISAYYHDSAACLVIDGEIISAAQEERFTRKKHDHSFPTNAINFCLESNNLKGSDIDIVAFYDKPFLKFERILETSLAYAPKGISLFLKAMPLWIKKKLWTKALIQEEMGFEGKILFPEHHLSHAASAFYPSPFEEAAFLTVDGVGEWTTTSYGVGECGKIAIHADINFPHSLGLLYSAITYFTGFKVNSGEYKVMGLAPYGEPKYKDLLLKEVIDLKQDGSFRLNMKYFDYCSGLKMTSSKFNKLFNAAPRKPETKLREIDMDLAASVQAVVEEIIIKMAKHIKEETGKKYLCLAGGVALNCVANGKLLRENIFEDIWIQPAAGDAGGALGAALAVHYQYNENKREMKKGQDFMQGSYLGSEYSPEEIEEFCKSEDIEYKKIEEPLLPDKIAELINSQNVIGLFQGKMEFGPRALGNRSIIGDARSAEMQKIMNLKIKFRESFRPFAPVVLSEEVTNYFDIDRKSPYMLLVAQVAKQHHKQLSEQQINLKGLNKLNAPRSSFPAITHVDYSARVQTVHKETNSFFYSILEKFNTNHGCPIIINTSFNVRGEPIVRSPQEAYLCFMRTNMDYLLMGDILLDKKNQKALDKDSEWQKEFELD
jgi:carbamoyltransferase